ncbi:MAG: GGDEF domain-containing protein, partial [Gammaproteobacteria bacterium]|nr:GGDEF domain-containing protein [Gammaproteobacteria bacterium]
RINDTHGHPAGDACLKAVAGMIREGLHWPGDVAARFGGEEFCILLPNTPYDAALTVIERIRQQIAGTPVRVEGKDIHLTISAGICTVSPAELDNAERALKLADTALYQAKANGRNRTESLHPTAEVQ